LLAAVVTFHAGMPGLSARNLAATTNPSEEEPESRQSAEEEVSANVLGSGPPRETGRSKARGFLVPLGTCTARGTHLATRSVVGSEHAGRNGVGGPLRC
jgi:hypothetical protein